MDFIGNSGAKGRLIYEVSPSSTDCRANNCVVEWRGPNGPGFLSLVELPFVLHNGRRSHHSHMIIQTLENSQRVKRLGCLIKVYGDDFGVPLKYCDPYALITGGSWQDVDEAVEAVRGAINMHMSTCACTFWLKPEIYRFYFFESRIPFHYFCLRSTYIIIAPQWTHLGVAQTCWNELMSEREATTELLLCYICIPTLTY